MPDKLTIEQRHANFRANRKQKNLDSYAEVQPKVTTVRSRNMAAIRAKNTKPEIIVRKFLWAHGFRYRLNHPRLPGKPDVVLRKYKTCIFVNGCFWHGHEVACGEVNSEERKVKREGVVEREVKREGIVEREVKRVSLMDFRKMQSSECCKIPKTNREFWVRKILRNKERDIEVQKKLALMGWHSIVVWECELKQKVKDKTLERLAFTLNHIFLQDHQIRRHEIPEENRLIRRYELPEEEVPMMF